jgi:hypothetical protein
MSTKITPVSRPKKAGFGLLAFLLIVSGLSAISVIVPSKAQAAAVSDYALNLNSTATTIVGANQKQVIPANTTDDFTIDTWVYLDSNTGGWQAIAVQDQGDTAITGSPSRFFFGFDSALNFHVGLAGFTATSRDYTFPTQTWKHVVLTVGQGSNNVNIYVDGVNEHSSTLTRTTTTAICGFTIGMNCHGGFELDGSLDQYKIWSGILTVNQIKQTRFSTVSETISGSVPTLRAYYDFNYSSAPAAIADKTGSGYDLSYTAGTATHPISSRPLVPFFSINAADTNSYPGSGATVTDLSPNQYSGNLGSATFNASDKTFNLGNNTPITFTDASTYKADLTNGISIQFAADINVATSTDWDIIFDFGTNQSNNYSRMQVWNLATTKNLSYYSIRSGTAYECRISGISSGMKMYSFNIDETGCTVQIDGSSVTTTVPLATYKAATPTTSSAWTLRVGSAIGGLNGIDGKLKSLVISSGTSEIRTVQFDPNSGSG